MMHAATTTAKKILKKERHYDASSSATAPYTAVGGRGRSPSSPPPAASVSDGKSTGGNDAKKKHLVWDEHAIEEHDLLRGTRMKVSPSNAHPTPPPRSPGFFYSAFLSSFVYGDDFVCRTGATLSECPDAHLEGNINKSPNDKSYPRADRRTENSLHGVRVSFRRGIRLLRSPSPLPRREPSEK